MAPRLNEPIKREVELDGQLYTLTLGPEGVHIAPKGKRKGHVRPLGWMIAPLSPRRASSIIA